MMGECLSMLEMSVLSTPVLCSLRNSGKCMTRLATPVGYSVNLAQRHSRVSEKSLNSQKDVGVSRVAVCTAIGCDVIEPCFSAAADSGGSSQHKLNRFSLLLAPAFQRVKMVNLFVK